MSPIKILFATIFVVVSAYFFRNLQSGEHGESILPSPLNNQCKPPAGRFSVLMESEAEKEEVDLSRQAEYIDIHQVRGGLRATDCTEGPMWKEGGFNVIQDKNTSTADQALIYQKENVDRCSDPDRCSVLSHSSGVQFERNCTGNPSRSDLRRNCSRSFLVWSAHAPGDGMVEVKCGERMFSGIVSQRYITGLMVLVVPENGSIGVWMVENDGAFRRGVFAVFPNIRTCARGVHDTVRQPTFYSQEFTDENLSEPIPIDVKTLNFSTPELNLLASTITTRSREERIRIKMSNSVILGFLMLDFQDSTMSAAATVLTFNVWASGPGYVAGKADYVFAFHCLSGMLHAVSLCTFHALADFATEIGEETVSIVLYVFFWYHTCQWVGTVRSFVIN